MENKDQDKQPSYANDSDSFVGMGEVHTPSLEVDSLSAMPDQSMLVSSQEQPQTLTSRFARFARRLDVILVVLLLLGGISAYFTIAHKKQQNNGAAVSQYGTIRVPLNDLVEGKKLTLGGNATVTINGPMQLNDALNLTPSLQPTGAKAGQIYYDQTTNQLAYFNGTTFVFLTNSPSGGVQSLGGATGPITLGSGLTMQNGQLSVTPTQSNTTPTTPTTNTGVLTVQGQSGDVVLTAGPGIIINGTNFSNSGVITVAAGTPNVHVDNDGNGNVTISVDTPIAGTGTVTSSGGTAGSIPLFTGAQNIENSIITQSGLTVTISGDLSVVTGGLSLSNALTVPNGGTGTNSLAANGILVGQGTAPVTSVTAASPGLCLLSTSGSPVWGACPSGSGVTSVNGLTGAINIANASAAGSTVTIDNASTTTKGIASFNGSNFTVSGGAVNTIQDINSSSTPTFAGVNTNSITPSAALTVGVSAQTALLQGSTTTITSNGAGNNIILNSAGTIELQDSTNVTGNISTTGDIAVNGGDLTSTGALNITPGGALTVGISSQALTLQGGATTSLRATSGANTTVVAFTNPVANTTLNFPALAAGTYTICTTSGNCSGAAATLQSTYNNSTDPEIVLDATRGALSIRDNSTPLGANLLEVQNNTGSATYLAVTSSGIAVTGAATVSGNVNASTGGLQTGGTTRIDNAGNGVNLGSLSVSGSISGATSITSSGNINTAGGVIQTNGTTRISNAGDLINIGAVLASGNAAFQGGNLTLGTSTQAASITLNDGSSNTGILQVAALGQNTTYTLPDPGTTTATICLTTGNCAGTGGGVTTGGGTTNKLAKFTGSQAIGDSSISDDGTNVTVSVDVVVQGGDLTLGSTTQPASMVLHDGNGQTTTLQAGNSVSNLTFVLPTNSGSANQCLKQSGVGNQLVWQDCDGGSGGSSATLQTAYNNSTNPEITLNSGVGGLTIRDNSTPIGGNLFEIQNNLGSTTYLGVTVSGVNVTGATTSSGNINSTSGALQTNSTTRIDNTGNAVNIGNITGSGAMTIASVGAGNDITIDGADQFIVQDSAVFNALSTFNANIDLGANSLIGTTGNIDLTNFDVVGATGNVTAGTYNGQTISSSANFTGTVTTAGNITTAGDIAVNGGDITSSSALNITPGGALTLGVSAQTALLQGSTTTIRSNGAGNNIVLDSAGTIELQDNTNITGNVTGGTYNGQTISTAANFTGTLTVAGNTTVNGNLAVNGGAITTAGALTIGSSTQALTLQGGATSTFKATSGANTTTIGFVTPIANTTLSFPALAAGTYTICTTSGNCSGAAATLQSTYDNSNNPEIVLDATRGALTIRDNSTPLGANLLEVQNNTGTTTYLGVTASGIAVTGTATVSGDLNTTGGVIKTAGTTRIDNTGNLVNIAAVTASGNASIQGGSVTVGTNSQAGTIVLNDGSSNTGTLQVAALGQNTVYTLPDPGAGTATICLTTGNCSGVAGGVTTSGGTTNKLAKFTGSQNIADSSISDDGTNVTVGVDVIIQGGDLTVGTTSQAASIVLHDGNGQTTSLQAGDSAGNLTFILPTNSGVANQCLKQSGTGNQLVWQDCDGGAGGSSATLQTTYNNSTNPEITLNSSVGGLTIRDNSTPIGGNLFEIQNNLGSTTYLGVTVSGVSVTGSASATGNVNSSGGALQTNGTTRIDNSGNAINIGNITGSGAITIASIGAGNDVTIDGADQFIVQDSAVFNALTTFNANINVGANNIIGTTGNIDLTNFDVVGATGNITAGTYNGQTISSSANFTGTVAVASNATLGGDIAVNGGDITSSGALNITPGGTLTVGATGQQLILQGSSNTQLTATGGGFTTTLGFSGVPTANVTYNFDRAAGAGTYTICTSIGNCSGVGGGVTTSGGTTGTLAKFTGAQTLGDSLLSESGSTVTVNGNLNLTSGKQFQVNGTQISSANLSNDANLAKLSASQTFTGNTIAFQNGTNSTNAFNVQNSLGNKVMTVDSTNGQIVLGTASSINGQLVFANVSNANTVTIAPGTLTANRTLTLPDASGIICTDSGNCAGAGATLQTGYDFSVGGTTPKIKLNSTLLGVDIQDADTTIGANLFNVRASNAAGLGSVMFGVGNTGAITLQNSSNSTTALRLLTAGGTAVLTGDTTNGQVLLGQSGTLGGILVFRNSTNANTVTISSSAVTSNQTITLPNASGTICLSTGNCSGSGSSNTLQAAYDAGNTITTTSARDINFALADTATDANFLVDLQCDTSCGANGRFAVQDDGVDVFSVAPAGGATVFKNSVNSTSAFNIQSSTGANMLTVDTSTGKVVIGRDDGFDGADAKLYFGDTANAANPWIGEANGTDSDILQLQGKNGVNVSAGASATNVLTLSSVGAALFKNASNSTTAFQVQRSDSTALLTVDTSGNVITLAGDLIQAGVQPASTTGNGTNGTISSLTAAKGGNTTGTTGQTAGNGGNYFVQGGDGGTAPAGSANGWGGSVFISGGAAGSGAGSAGFRGNVILQGNGGTVGIGTLSPSTSYKLDVAGDINISSGSSYRINGTAICTSSGCTPASGSSNYIQNQNSVDQTSSNFRISGTGRAATSFQAPLYDTATAVALNVGTTNATAINLNKATTVTGNFTQSGGSFSGTSTSTASLSAATGMTLQTTSGNLLLQTNNASSKIIAKAQVDSTSAFQVQNSGGGYVVNVDTTNAIVGLGVLNVGVNGTGSTIDTYYNAATLEIGRTNAGAISVGNSTNSTILLQGNNTSSAVSVQAAAGGTISVGTAANNTLALGTGTVAGTITVGGTAQTGTITLGQSTATNTIAIGTAAGASSTQTINIGTSATASSATIVTVGSAIGTSTTTIKGGTGSGAIALTPGTNGSINATTTGTGNINLNSAASIFAKSTTNGTTAFQVQNSSGASMLNVNTSANIISLNTGVSSTLGTWNTTTSMGTSFSFGSSVVANGYVYTFGGFGPTWQSAVQYAPLRADGTVGSWTTTTSLPANVAYTISSVTTYNGFVYVVGGTPDGTTVTSTVYYAHLNSDGSISAWRTTTSIPTAAKGVAVTVANGYMYALGGDNGAPLTSTQYAPINANGTLGAWTSGTALPTALGFGSAVVSNGYLYHIGGNNGSTNVTSVYYTPINSLTGAMGGTWTTNSNSLPGITSSASSIVYNGYVYAINGGLTAVYAAPLSVTGGTGAFTSSSLPAAKSGASAVLSNGYFYLLGGYNGSTGTTSVYYSSAARTLINGALDLVGTSSGTISGDNNGDIGGSLTAGNTNIVGTLNVQSQATFSQSLSVDGNVNVGSDSSSTATNTISIKSGGYAGLVINGDSNNTTGEPGGSFINIYQDAQGTFATLGMIQTADTSPDGNNTYTDALSNATLFGTVTNQQLQFGTDATVKMTIMNGTTAHVCVNTTTCTKTFGVSGTIGASGAITASTTPDLAETINAAPDVEAADVVMADPDSTERVVKTNGAYAVGAVGVISDGTSSFMINSYANDPSAPLTGKPLVLAGRVPVKVTDEGGSIKPGDYLTSSSTPGYAMKATHAGPTIGKALGYFNGDKGKVLVLVNVSYYDPNGGLQGGAGSFSSLNVAGNATINGTLTVTAIKVADLFVSGHIVTTGSAPQLQVQPAAGSGAQVSVSGNDTAGRITITAGNAADADKLVRLIFNTSFDGTPEVVITPVGKGSAAALGYVDDVTTDGFSLGVNVQPTSGATYIFNYHVLSAK